ncbi:MAG: hypothetical protein KC449_17000 [Anaerolineales bacterium]|nr:hypothetical protein [Anaerolineales bacterium]
MNVSNTSAVVAELVALGRRQFETDLGDTGQSFDDMVWDVTILASRAHNGALRLYFTRYDTHNEPLPASYAEVVKSWVLLSRQSSAADMRNNLASARILWDAIRQRHNGLLAEFNWSTLCEEDLRQAQSLMISHWALSTAHKMGQRITLLAQFLAARQICSPVYYTLQTPRPRDFNNHTLAGQAARRAKLPSPNALNGLADIYRELAVEPSDRLLSAAIAILAVTGFRAGELLTLPEDCEVREEYEGRIAYGIRYYKEKSKGGRKMLAVRWLTPLQAELAQAAIAEIRQLTAAARVQAKELETQPDRIVLPGIAPEEYLSAQEVCDLLGYRSPSTIHKWFQTGFPHEYQGGKCVIRAQDLADYLYRKRRQFLWTVNRKDGTYQMLSETLLIAPRHFFRRGSGNVSLLIDPVVNQQVNDFLKSRDHMKSAFERFDIREVDGAICAITSHQLRHWLNDLADKGGLPIDLLTRWMGREYPYDTEAYRHASVDERLAWVKQGIQEEKLSGVMTDVYFELPEGERDVFLSGQIQAVHFTPMGICIHDFAIEPCLFHLNCVRGCPDYLHTKGNQRERDHLLQIREHTEKALAHARQQISEGKQNLAEAWIAHHEATLQGIEAALAVDSEAEVVGGEVVKPFATSLPAQGEAGGMKHG